jgi:hypothetical protein
MFTVVRCPLSVVRCPLGVKTDCNNFLLNHYQVSTDKAVNNARNPGRLRLNDRVLNITHEYTNFSSFFRFLSQHIGVDVVPLSPVVRVSEGGMGKQTVEEFGDDL